MSYGKSRNSVPLPGDPWAGDTSQRLILDADGAVIHNPAWRYGAGVADDEEPVRVAELSNARWNGYEVMRAQGSRDGQNFRESGGDVRQSRRAPGTDRAPPPPLARPSIGMMAEATNDAFNKAWEGHGARGASSGLSTEFSRIERLPDFSKGKWKKVYSTHASEAYEHALPGRSGMVVKVYRKDREHKGLDTATITAPTESIDHYGAWPAYKMGLPVNSRNAAIYMADQRAPEKAEQ